MIGYVIRRLAQAVAVLVLVTLLVFGIMSAGPPGSVRASLGPGLTGQPFIVQYLGWVGRVLSGNLGFSTSHNETVAALLASSLPRTIALAGIATLAALLIAVPVGIAQAARRGRMADHTLRAVTTVLFGTPAFVLGSVLILTFAVKLHAFGAEGPQAPGFAGMLTDWRDLTLPVVTLTAVTVAQFSRYMRSSAVEVLAEDYVRTARAKGSPEVRVMWRHVIRNAATPMITLVGLSLPQIVAGALVIESLFNIQGVGYQIWLAAQNHDLPVIMGFTLIIAAAATLGSLLADLGYAIADPRVRAVPR